MFENIIEQIGNFSSFKLFALTFYVLAAMYFIFLLGRCIRELWRLG